MAKKLNLQENAFKNHAELFPDFKSTLQDTDPEIAELFLNLAYGEAVDYANLDIKVRVMALLAATIATQAQQPINICLMQR